MPPQQPDRLLDLFDKAFDFRTHLGSLSFIQNNGTRAARKDITAGLNRCSVPMQSGQ